MLIKIYMILLNSFSRCPTRIGPNLVVWSNRIAVVAAAASCVVGTKVPSRFE